MTMSSLVQIIVSEFLGFPCRFLNRRHGLRAMVRALSGIVGRKYTTFAGWVCRGRQDFSVERAEDSGGDDNPVQGCTKRVTLKAERCRRRHFFHIPDRIRATSCQRSPASDTADATNRPWSKIGRRFADDSTSIPSLGDSHV